MQLDDTTIQAFVTKHPNWSYATDALHSSRTFATFMAAIAAINMIAHEAEAADHHPDLCLSYTNLTITLTSHDEGGVTARDLALATRIDTLLAG